MRSLLLLTLLALPFASCSDAGTSGNGSSPKNAWQTERPGNACAYPIETIGRLVKLIDRGAWERPVWSEKGLLETVHSKTGLTFVLVPEGGYSMGSAEETMHSRPVRTVAVRSFLLCRTECTQAAWDQLDGMDDRQFKGGQLPIESMTQAQMDAWCLAAGLRLPSEEEWEYACRAGSTTTWSFGDDASRLPEHAWYVRNSGHQPIPPEEEWDKEKVNGEWGCAPHPVGMLEPNAFGFYDMHGNLWEQCSDIEQGRLEDGPLGNSSSVIRGGSWYSEGEWTHSATRYLTMHDDMEKQLGRTLVGESVDRMMGSSPEKVEVTDFEWGGSRSPHLGFRPATDLP